jgi:DNA-binding LacI/PurR family transcriptional regulator/biotin operon repressor
LADLSVASPRARVIHWVVDAIGSKKLVVGAPIPAERLLAERLGVSRTTVRAALGDLENRGVVVQAGNGYCRCVAPRMPDGRQSIALAEVLGDTIAILSNTRPREDDPTNQTDTALAAVSRQIEAAGYHALVVNASRLAERGVDSLALSGPKGLLAVDEVDSSPVVRDVLSSFRERMPAVVRGCGPESRRYDRVNPDHEGGTYALTRWLLQQGRRRILRVWQVSGRPDWLDLRSAGYERALREAGLDPLPAVEIPALPSGGLDEQDLRSNARLFAGFLLEHVRAAEPVDAILLATDAHAYRAAAALRLLGLSPNEDVLLAGFDNLVGRLPWSRWEPWIRTMRKAAE